MRLLGYLALGYAISLLLGAAYATAALTDALIVRSARWGAERAARRECHAWVHARRRTR